ncbi:uncharacterized protein LOC127737859 [Mytilus californianus]|uniref:uncharacterized protein LOC127737859 n=1 Tax=Mytilus californianus TaxID=6549 RepID=UPI002248135C|nr:uncharacterized protein LOC127737859 [Mytilus californianus]
MDYFFVSFLCIISLAKTEETKRLLLNDPDVIGSRLSNIEKSMQEMTRLTSQLQTEFGQEKAKMQTIIFQLQTALTQVLKDQGSVYVRWGRKQCSALNTVLVYTGFATGQEYSRGTYYGGPANYLCLPNNPELSNITGPGRSVLYGTEFEHGDYFKKGADQEDVPCALCRSENTSATVMIPGRQTCYRGWKMEYHGILGSNAYEYKASSYICVDSDPECVQGGERNNNENLIYPTTAKCGSLPCPPYGSQY